MRCTSFFSLRVRNGGSAKQLLDPWVVLERAEGELRISRRSTRPRFGVLVLLGRQVAVAARAAQHGHERRAVAEDAGARVVAIARAPFHDHAVDLDALKPWSVGI